MFAKRLTTQARQIQRAFLHMVNETLTVVGTLGSTSSPSDWLSILKGASLSHSSAFQQIDSAPFERDYFNLHKIIVVVTSIGKVNAFSFNK